MHSHTENYEDILNSVSANGIINVDSDEDIFINITGMIQEEFPYDNENFFNS